MKALLIGNFGTGWDGSICDEENVARSLETLGHEVMRQQRETGWNGPVPDIDFVLLFQWDGYPEKMGFSEAGVPVIYWAFDYQKQDQEWHTRLIENADLYLSKRLADSIYPNWQWACDFAPDFLWRYAPVKKDIDVLFTGTWLPWAHERNAILKEVNKHFNFVVHSVNPGEWPEQFKHVNGPQMDDALPLLIARTKVNLAVDHTHEAGYWSDRAAQILACGGFCLQRYVPFIESYFHSNLAYFRNHSDVVSQVQWWLEHDEDRDYFAAEAFDVSRQYMCKQRVADVLEIIRSKL